MTRVILQAGKVGQRRAHAALGTWNEVSRGVGVTCCWGSSTSSRYSSTASARLLSASGIEQPWLATSTSRHCATYQSSSWCTAAVKFRGASTTPVWHLPDPSSARLHEMRTGRRCRVAPPRTARWTAPQGPTLAGLLRPGDQRLVRAHGPISPASRLPSTRQGRLGRAAAARRTA